MTQKSKVIDFVIDAEFANPEQFKVTIGKTEYSYMKYKDFVFGIYTQINDSEFYELIRDDFGGALRLIMSKMHEWGYKHADIYSFFTLAELSVQKSTFSQILTDLNLEIKRIYKSTKSYNMVLQNKKNGSILRLIDAKILSQSQNLKSFVSVFAPTVQNPKEFLKSLNVEHDENLMNRLSESDLYTYNYLDCKSLFVAVKNFKSYMNDTINSLFGFTVNDNVETLGGFARQILEKLDVNNDLGIYNDYLENKLPYDSCLTDLLQHARQFYRGGGLIINYLPLMSRSKFISGGMWDVVSLYPLSGIFASKFVNGFKNAKFVKTIKNYIDKPTEYGGFFAVQLRMRNRELPIVGFRQLDRSVTDLDEQKYEIFYVKNVPRQWYSLQELHYLLKHGYELVGEPYGFVWRIQSGYSPTYDYFIKLLTMRNKMQDEIKRLLIKYLLNIAYGKLVQKDITPIVNPVFGAYLTSISRLIMMYLVDATHPYHVATDSIITNRKFNPDDVLNQILNDLSVEKPDGYTFMKNEINGQWFIYKCKAYTSIPINEDSKMAHHAIRLSGKKTLINFFDQLIHLRTNYAFYMTRSNWFGYDKIQHLVDLKKSKLLISTAILDDIANLQQILFKPTIEEQIHIMGMDYTFPLKSFGWTYHIIDNNKRIFDNVTEAKQYRKKFERTRQRIRDNIRNAINGKEYKKLRCEEPYDMYNDGYKLIRMND